MLQSSTATKTVGKRSTSHASSPAAENRARKTSRESTSDATTASSSKLDQRATKSATRIPVLTGNASGKAVGPGTISLFRTKNVSIAGEMIMGDSRPLNEQISCVTNAARIEDF